MNDALEPLKALIQVLKDMNHPANRLIQLLKFLIQGLKILNQLPSALIQLLKVLIQALKTLNQRLKITPIGGKASSAKG